MNNTEPTKESDKALSSMNYNDRLDGYGFGEAESMDTNWEYEEDPHFTKHCIVFGHGYRRFKDQPWTQDEYGLRNQYGPVDQYSFRSYHLFTRDGRYSKKDDDTKS